MRRITHSVFIVACLLFLFVHTAYVVSGVRSLGIRSMDTIGIWYLKARALSVYGVRSFAQFLHDDSYAYAHATYPIGLPAVFFGVSVVTQQPIEVAVPVLSPIAYITILLLLWIILKKQFSTVFSAGMVCLYASFSVFLAQSGRGHLGNADLFFVLVIWIIVFCFQHTYQREHRVWLYALLFFIACASQIKTEGIFTLFFLLFLPISKTKKILYGCIAATPFLLWNGYLLRNSIHNDFGYVLYTVPHIVYRLFVVFQSTMIEMTKMDSWYFFWPLFFLLCAIHIKNGKGMAFEQQLARICLMFACAYTINYLFSSLEIQSYVSSSIDRVLFQLSPFIFLLFCRFVHFELERWMRNMRKASKKE